MTQRYLEIYLFFEKDNFKNGGYDYLNIYWKLEEKKTSFLFVSLVWWWVKLENNFMRFVQIQISRGFDFGQNSSEIL